MELTQVQEREEAATHPEIDHPDPIFSDDLPPAGNGPRKKILFGAAAVAVVIIGVLFMVLKYRAVAAADSKTSETKTTETPVPANPDLIKLEAAQMQSVKTEAIDQKVFHAEKNATGKIAFNEEFFTPVFSPYTGRVTRLIARPGDQVKPGAPLFEIDTPDLGQAESDLITAAAGVTKAKTLLELAKRTEDRQHKLYAAKAAALKDWEQAESDLKNAETDVRSAEANLAGTAEKLKVLGKTEAEIDTIERDRRIDRLTRVFSPIAGTVTARKVGTGQYVKPDSPDPLFVVANLSSMWMLADIYESDVALIKTGQQVEVRVMAYPGENFKAKVAYIGASVDPSTHRVAVRAEVENRGLKLKPEMFASFRIMTNTEVPGLAVRKNAIVREGEKTSVWVVEGSNQFARRDVSLGIDEGDYVQVLSGVKAGDRVVYDGSLFLSNMAKS